MKTLIINGSPRKNGDTIALIDSFTNQLNGSFKMIDAYYCNIKACLDCRYCWTHEGCQIKDEMQELYQYIETCDNILIASPLYFSELSGQLLAVMSRLQTYFASRFFRQVIPINKEKKGGLIIVGGGDGSIEKGFSTGRVLLRHMNAKNIGPLVTSHNTNHLEAKFDSKALDEVSLLAQFFNE